MYIDPINIYINIYIQNINIYYIQILKRDNAYVPGRRSGTSRPLCWPEQRFSLGGGAEEGRDHLSAPTSPDPPPPILCSSPLPLLAILGS